jgi:GNAT superfamily N-acetyltransferase
MNLNKNINKYSIVETGKLKQNLMEITEMIYNNFIELNNYTELKHTHKDIFELLRKDEFKGLFVYSEHNKLIAYLLGEIMITNDGRRIFYISYIFTCKNYRNNGIASNLIKIIINKCKNIYGINFITLTCNINHQKTCNLYRKMGFKEDFEIKTIHPFIVLTYQME